MLLVRLPMLQALRRMPLARLLLALPTLLPVPLPVLPPMRPTLPAPLSRTPVKPCRTLARRCSRSPN